MKSRMKFGDTMPLIKGHFLAEAYKGDVRRAPLSLRQIRENLTELQLSRAEKRLPRFWHRGAVLNEKVWEADKNNLIITLGKQIALDRLFGLSSIVALTHMGVGTDSTAASIGQNKLNPSVAGSVSILAFDATPTRSSQTVTAIRTWDTATGNFSWNELGLANSATNDGTHLFNRLVIGPFNKTPAVSIVVTFQLTQS